MKTQQLQIIRKYKRQSKSKWQEQDDSTILLLATVDNVKSLSLKYDRYIYLHRDEVGKWLGISLSNQIQDELGDDIGKYREGLDMLEVLLKFHCEIFNFLEHFSDEIESIMGIDVFGWLEAAELRWHSKLKDAGRISDS
ncbi:hypothetical protein [Glaciecola sp. 1036]|uniref:hypothetical protein n=1 Tax=Alteromonadaceae TaxID=72275 RepID=UPI003D00C92E|tara:strand:- start:15 stop:431 length:417 start_codon:yes stop_codon:yes gene_type:complete